MYFVIKTTLVLHQSMNNNTGEHNSTDYIDKVLPLHSPRYNLNPDLILLVSQKKRQRKIKIISFDKTAFLNIMISLMNQKHQFLLKCRKVLYI